MKKKSTETTQAEITQGRNDLKPQQPVTLLTSFK